MMHSGSSWSWFMPLQANFGPLDVLDATLILWGDFYHFATPNMFCKKVEQKRYDYDSHLPEVRWHTITFSTKNAVNQKNILYNVCAGSLLGVKRCAMLEPFWTTVQSLLALTKLSEPRPSLQQCLKSAVWPAVCWLVFTLTQRSATETYLVQSESNSVVVNMP